MIQVSSLTRSKKIGYHCHRLYVLLQHCFLATVINKASPLIGRLFGLLTHAGSTFGAHFPSESSLKNTCFSLSTSFTSTRENFRGNTLKDTMKFVQVSAENVASSCRDSMGKLGVIDSDEKWGFTRRLFFV